MELSDPNDCPNICPTNKNAMGKHHKEGTKPSSTDNKFAAAYTPGMIVPPETKIYPRGAPPRYLPQPTDSTSGDILGMGPIGPWAPGHIDWTPQAGMTGVRPVVDKYSITRYSTGEWRKNNERVLTPRAPNKARDFEVLTKKEIDDAFKNIDDKEQISSKMLDTRTKELKYWKKEVENALMAMIDEIDTLDEDRMLLKGACRILMLPEAISRECLELRTNRYEPDLVRDDAEQELIKEVAIVGEIRRLFNNTLAKVEDQMLNNKAAKAALENDWSDKMVTLKLDKHNLNLSSKSNLIFYHPGVVRWPENGTTYEYWLHYCAESIKNCDEVREKSKELRKNLKTIIIKGSQDMKIQADRTNLALAETVAATEEACDHLERNLNDNLQRIADIEKLIDHLTVKLQELQETIKTGKTRLHSRNYDRPGVENCRDEAQYALMAQAKYTKETIDSFNDKMRQAQAIRAELMRYRGELEKEIACKRKSLNIDKDRCSRIRAHMPTPEEFAGKA